MKRHDRHPASRSTVLFSLCTVLLLSSCSKPEPDCFECGLTDEWARAEAKRRDDLRVDYARDALEVPQGVEIQGHRGARGLRPEETLPSFEAALDLEVDTLELDLHLTKDDQLVVWHDPYIDREKCNVARRLVRDMTAHELASVSCERNPDEARFPEQKAVAGDLSGDMWGIVTLSDLFEFVEIYSQSEMKSDSQRRNAASVRFNIETKRHPDEPHLIGDEFDGSEPGTFERAFVREVVAAGLLDRVTLQSFDHRSLWAAQKLEPDLQLAVLQRRTEPSDFALWVSRGAAIWSPDHRLVDADSIASAHEAGFEVIPWTVNDRERMKELVDFGVDGIITDRPDLLRHSRRADRTK